MDPLLERAGTLSTLEDRLAGVRSSSQGRLVLVGGEAGVGKTALLRRFCESVPVRVCGVPASRCGGRTRRRST